MFRYSIFFFKETDRLFKGLIPGHGYILTDIQDVHLPEELVKKLNCHTSLRVVRLRNPWGEKEWTGAWSERLGFFASIVLYA